MIKVNQLFKTLDTDKEVLTGVDFEIDQGEFIVLIGASGSGKTTLFRCLMLLEEWDKRKFNYDGLDMLSSKRRGKRKIRKEWSYIEEKPTFNENKTALKNVMAGQSKQPLWRTFTGIVSQDEHVRVMDYLEDVGLIDKAKLKIGQLSGGERQRVAIARALSQGTKVVVADEPISGLDPDSANRVMLDLQTLCRTQNVTVICSLHKIEIAEKFASRLWGIANGKIVVDTKNRRLTQQEKQLIFDND